jgi:hypothetical protein
MKKKKEETTENTERAKDLMERFQLVRKAISGLTSFDAMGLLAGAHALIVKEMLKES